MIKALGSAKNWFTLAPCGLARSLTLRLRPRSTRAKPQDPILDDEKLKLISDVYKSLSITESIAVVPATDIMAMIQTIRNYQQQVVRIQTSPAWVDQTIERLKNATGRNFGEG